MGLLTTRLGSAPLDSLPDSSQRRAESSKSVDRKRVNGVEEECVRVRSRSMQIEIQFAECIHFVTPHRTKLKAEGGVQSVARDLQPACNGCIV